MRGARHRRCRRPRPACAVPDAGSARPPSRPSTGGECRRSSGRSSNRNARQRCRTPRARAAPWLLPEPGGSRNRFGCRVWVPKRSGRISSRLSDPCSSGTTIAANRIGRTSSAESRMPELPEVETVRRGLARYMTGRRIVRAELRRPDLRRPFPPDLAERLDGAQVGALTRRGKYILIELDDSGHLLLHLGMSGRITAGAADVPPERHDHVVLTLDDGTVIRFNDARRFGLLDYIPRGQEGAHKLLAGLGPEPLESGFDAGHLN